MRAAPSDPRQGRPPGAAAGFTLVEVMVVVVILGLMAGILAPRVVRPLFASDVRLATRRVAALVALVRDRAVRTHRVYRLHYDPDHETLKVTYLAPSGEDKDDDGSLTGKQRLPGGVDLVDVITQFQGRRPEGSERNLFTTFLPNGYVERTLIHVRAGEERFTWIVEPLTGQVRRVEGFVEEVAAAK
ncbi:MAG: prepilin-type N-terminal cleavage/methylation domain-containing protein [Nitrospirae bacterium]|nr:MAG: prepilin-type N-terminal cleavage/methylation domain-containing protein [Nitrospirota bacterium]